MGTQQWIRMIKFICEMSANLVGKEHLLDIEDCVTYRMMKW